MYKFYLNTYEYGFNLDLTQNSLSVSNEHKKTLFLVISSPGTFFRVIQLDYSQLNDPKLKSTMTFNKQSMWNKAEFEPIYILNSVGNYG